MYPGPDDPLRVAYLSYRGKPHVGGQGVYTRHLTKALVDLGHTVEVLGGQPYPVLDGRVRLTKLASLDLFNDHYPGRFPAYWEIKHVGDVVEVLQFSAGTFSEPLAFSVRAWQELKRRPCEFDLVHDNQSLGYGLLAIEKRLPTIVTLHHPITVDRRLEMEHAPNRRKRIGVGRWYSFVKMQARVARQMPRIVVVSENSIKDIHDDMGVDTNRMRLVPVGVDPDLFSPRPAIERIPGRLITTASADVALKGLAYLLEAIAKLRTEREVTLTIIGRPKPGGRAADAIDRLGLADAITWRSGLTDEEIVDLYAEAALAVVPSLYEGFSLPAVEAMSTGICLVATTGGALPEVTGADGETVLSCPPGDVDALVATIRRGLDRPDLRVRVGAAGRARRGRAVELASLRAAHRGPIPRGVGPPREPGQAAPAADRSGALMLTVRYPRLGLAAGDLLLDVGCGFGRHAYQAARLGARVVALDYAEAELKEVRNTFGAMAAADEVGEASVSGTVQGDGTRLPFADSAFDRVIASEVLEHIPDDDAALGELARVLRPGGTIAVTVPSWVPERVCWRLSDEYHAPFVEGGHVRIYRESELRSKLRTAGLEPDSSHRAHALHSPYWWLRCAVGPTNETHRAVVSYRKVLEWDILRAPKVTRWADWALNPVVGKSLVVYARKPAS